MGSYYSRPEKEKKIGFKKTIDRLFIVTGVLAAADFIPGALLSFKSQGDLQTLHEIIGMPPQTNETAMAIGLTYGALTLAYLAGKYIAFKKKMRS